MEQDSDKTISSTFFDNLWPLILNENRSDIQSDDSIENFIPQREFDNLSAHEFLACQNFNNFKAPIELKCSQSKEGEQTPERDVREIKQLPYRDPIILPLDQQLANIEKDVEVRKKLAHDFANRTFPWYIQRPSYEYSFTITDEMRLQFNNSFEYEILKEIQLFNCNLMLIDVVSAVPLRDLECWEKFAPYVAIITIIHNEQLFKEIKNFNHIFHAVFMEDDALSTWQEKLNHSIKEGLNLAKKLYLYDDMCKPFVFVFSTARSICGFDKFKVLRKS